MSKSLAEQIQALEFDTVFRIEHAPSRVVEVSNEYAPEIYHDDVNDVDIHGDGWECFTGLTGQYSYNGAVMHPSEYVGDRIVEMLDEYSYDRDGDVIFALVTVEDLDSENDNDAPIGWAICYRETNR